ncbi:autotransporter-associated beta strand repeat-containing protein [Mesorhizobium sp. 8]|uniref:autotransporter-associated beta strand repeat-containing protein n=1 Tax=Mesorhizobium sp. 8 TaxID=2584466 RepID=UPI00111D65C0|nr:autotransporter-associated beta strand repeat-containing protein [Mesorhizobium sp. 8]QDB99456.1 autotransporter outer membrane beta-barrel domain-containing protein [Mesorhizobium sp. 8]
MTKWKGEAASYAPNLATYVSSSAKALGTTLLPMAVLIASVAGPAFAADRYWDVNQTAAGSGGTGIWDLGNLYWSDNSSDTLGPYNQPWANGDNAIFAGTAGTVTLGAPIIANGLTFSTSGYTIAGSANILTLGGTTPTVSVTAGTSTISAIIAGSDGLAKAGAGTLFLTGANTFSGGITLSGGVLRASNNAAFGAPGNIITTTTNATLTVDSGTMDRSVSIAGGTTLTVSGAGVGAAQFTGSGNLSVASGATLSNDSSNFTGTVQLNGVGQGVGNVAFTSVRNVGEASSLGAGGTITFTAGSQFSDNITYIGDGDSSNRDWVLSGSTLRRFNNSGTGTLILTGNFNLAQNTQFNAASGDFDLQGILSGVASGVTFTAAAARSVTLAGANTFAGTVILNGGGTINASVLADAGLASSFGQGSAIAINGATLRYTGGATSTDRTWVLSNNTMLQNDGTGGLTLTGAIAFDPVASIDTLNLGGSYAGENTIASNIGDSGRIVANGAGTWVLSGDNSYTGGTTVESGTLRAGSATAFNQLSSLTVNGGTFDLGSYDYSFTRLDGTGGTVQLGAGGLTVGVATGISSSFAGSIQGSGGFTKGGGGTQTLTGASTYTGDTNIAGGTLALDFSSAGGPTSNIISSASALNMAGGTVQVTGAAGEANSQTFNGLNLTGGSNRVTVAAGASGGTVLVNFGNVIRTGGQIDFGIDAGTTMTVAPGTTLGGWATVNATDYADVDASNNIIAFTAYDLKDDAGTWVDGDIVTDTGGAASTPFFGTVSEAGGDNVVQLGGLRYTVARNSGVNVGAGQTLGVDGTIIVADSVGSASQTIFGGSVRGAVGGALGIQQNSAGTFTINSTIVNSGGATGLTVGGIGAGTVALGNPDNSYTGATWVTRGRLSVATLADGGTNSSIGASLADSSNLVLEGGTLNYTGGNVTTDRGFTLMRSGAITGGTIQVTQSATNLTFGGEIVSPDGAGLTKTGSGMLTLTSAGSSYTGATRITSGTLSVATLANGGAASSIGASSSDSANLVLQAGATLQYTGGSVTTDRGFTIGGSAGGAIDVADANTVLEFSGAVVADDYAPLLKEGAGTLVLSGTNTYVGSTLINGGTLRAGSAEAFGRASTMRLADAAGVTLDLAGFDIKVGGLEGGGANGGTVTLGGATLTIGGLNVTFNGEVSGAGGLIKENSSTQTFVGCGNSYSGPTTIQGGMLSVDCIRNGGETSGIGASTAAASNLVLTNSGTLQYTGDTVTTDRGFHLAGGWGGFAVTKATTTLEFTGNVTNAASGGLVKDGAGALKLSGTNTYGATLLREGTLIAGSNQALGTGSMAVYAGATLDLADNPNSLFALDDSNDVGGTVRLGSADLTITNGGANFFGTIQGTGGLIKNGGGGQGLGGCDNSYSGGTVLNGGWIYADCIRDGGLNSSIGSSSADASNLVIGGTGAAGLLYNGSENATTDRRFTMGNTAYLRSSGTGTLNFTSTAAISHTGTGARQLRLGGTNSGTNILAAQIVDNGASAVSLVKDQAGTWRLTNSTSSYTGATITTADGGVLEVTKLADGGENSSIGASTAAAGNLVISTNGTLRYVGAGDSTNRLFTLGTGTTIIESSGTGAVNFTDSGGLMGFTGIGARAFTLGGTYAGDNIMGVTIRDQSGANQTSLAKNDAGTWILTADNTYTGNTVINDGKLIIGNGGTTGNVGTGEVILAFSTGTLGFNRSDAGGFNFAGKISGPGIIEQMGEGTTVLTATNSAGMTRITEGVLQVDGGLTTGMIVFDDDEATTLTVNGTVQGNGLPVTIAGDGASNIINVNAGGTLTATGDLGSGSDTLNVSGTLDTGAGVLGLGVGNDTLVLNDTAVFSGGGVDAGTGGESGVGDTLQVVADTGRTLDGGNIANFESLDKKGAGTLMLTGDHNYGAGTRIESGDLRIGNGATPATLATPTVANEGSLSFFLNSDYSFDGVISGSGRVGSFGTGVITLTGNNSYAGSTTVNAGTLIINGDQSGAQGQTNVGFSATLGGNGTVGGEVRSLGAINPGGVGNLPGTLNINGNLLLLAGSLNYDFGRAGVPGGAFNDLINVGGNLTLDGTLNITQTPGGTFGPGVYRLINYGGTLTDNGLNVASPDYFVQTSIDKQVNLVNSIGLALSFWDGDTGPHSDSAVDGGSGVWRAAGDRNWTDATGLFAAPFDNASFAIFQGAAGTVDVDSTTNGQVQAVGMQFDVDGYVVQGEGIVLVDDSTQPGLQSIIRVGDGTVAGAGYSATISSSLTGTTQLVKTDLGTLVLSGTNTYTAGTAINGGTIQISSNGNLGAAGGALSLNGGTLRNTAAIVTGRAVVLNAGGGTFDTLADLTLSGAVGGVGVLNKTSAGTLVLTGTNSYQGGTIINGGTVEVSANANLGNAAGGLTFDGGTLHTTGTFAAARSVVLNSGGGTFQTDGGTILSLANAMAGAGMLTKDGAGTLVLSADNVYGGGTTIAGGTLQLGAGGAAGTIAGDVTNDGTLAFNRSDSYAFSGQISGTGSLEQIGSGTTVLAADNSYTAATTVRAGTLIVNGDQTAAAGLTTVEDGGTLGGIGTIGGNVDVLDGGALNPGKPGTTPGMLTIKGGLTLAANASLNYNFGQAGVVGGAYNDLTVVQGDLNLDGTINVAETRGGDFGPGIYRIISYGGALNDSGLATTSTDYNVQTSIDKQVNLVSTAGLVLSYWDGDTGPANQSNGAIEGGDGTWRAGGNTLWTQDDGALNGTFDNGSFAVFAGTGGTVTVDGAFGAIDVAGMQFAAEGYIIQGSDVTLDGPQSTIRVGDGTIPGSAYLATIASNLIGNSELVKTDLGTLVLAGANRYTGGTAINSGTLQVSADANLGAAPGELSFDGGTLTATLAFASARDVTLNAGGGTFDTQADLALSGVLGGTGSLTKTGNGALVLSGSNAYAGATTVAEGSLYVDGDQSGATGLTTVRTGAMLGGGGAIGGSVTIADGGVLNPGAADGTPGTLAIMGDLALSGGSVLNYSFGKANVVGGTLNDLVTVGGNLVLDGTLNVTETPGGTFGPGIYRVFTYNGSLTNNGLLVGTIPSSGYFVQTAVANQVNLVNTAGLALSYWDGDAGPKFDGVVNGGNGIWQSSAGNDNWTDATGAVNAGYGNGAFPVFAGAAGTVTVDNSLGQVTASGLQFAVNGYAINGEDILLGGPASTIRVGDGTGAGAEMAAMITAALIGDTQLIKTDLGTLVLSGTNSYIDGTAINGGTLQVSSDANLGDGSGALSFDGGTLRNTASFSSGRNVTVNAGGGTFETDADLALSGVIGGTGPLTKAGAGVLALSGDSSSFAGTTSIAAGTLSLRGSLCGNMKVLAGGRLEGTGTVCDTDNAGAVAPGIGGIGTLTVDGTYSGNRGTLEIESELGGDASRTDRLIVAGNTSGDTNVKVANVGGGGAQTVEGIKIIDVGGASDGKFSLLGDYLFEGQQATVAGAYAYRLYKGGVSTPSDGDWYLRSAYINPDDPEPQPLYAPSTSIYEAYAGVLQSFDQLDTLQQRVGNRSWGPGATPQGADDPTVGPVDGHAIWARIEAAHAELDPGTSTTGTDYDVTTWKMQAGLDALLHEGEAGVLIFGITVHYGTVSSNVFSPFGTGSIDATGYGFGGTLTWYGNSGFYVDAQAQATWYNSDLTSYTLGRRLVEGNNGFGHAFSLESGQKISVTDKWSLTPQAQLAYSSVRFDDFTDPFGAAVSLADGDSLVGRLGLSSDYENQWVDEAGKVSRAHLYGIANLYYGFLEGSKVDVSGTTLASENQSLWGGLGLGGSLSWDDGRYAVFGEAFARTSLQDFGDSNALGGKLGLSVKW